MSAKTTTTMMRVGIGELGIDDVVFHLAISLTLRVCMPESLQRFNSGRFSLVLTGMMSRFERAH